MDLIPRSGSIGQRRKRDSCSGPPLEPGWEWGLFKLPYFYTVFTYQFKSIELQLALPKIAAPRKKRKFNCNVDPGTAQWLPRRYREADVRPLSMGR